MTAFRATYSDWKLIKTRGVVQVVMEIPLADADAAYDVLGGMPVHGKERWFGIAALKPGKEAMPNSQQLSGQHNALPRQEIPHDSRPDGAKRKMDWRDMQPAAQAGLRCAEPLFRAFLREVKRYGHCDEEEAAIAVRDICGVKSRADLGTVHAARVIWHQLDSEYLAWRAKERVGA
jgi:hypothetical protein